MSNILSTVHPELVSEWSEKNLDGLYWQERKLHRSVMEFQILSLLFFVKHFSLKKASEFPVFIKGFSLLLAGNIYASLRMSACSMR